MRILHITPSLDQRDGGTTMAIGSMARSLAAHGFDVDVAATLSPSDAKQQGLVFDKPTKTDGVTIRYFERQTTFYKTSLPLSHWLNQHAQEYDLVHIHAVFSFSSLAGAHAARTKRVPYIISPHGILNSWGMKNRRSWIKALSYRLLDKPMLNRAAAIHFTSKQEQDDAARLQLKPESWVIPLGVNLAPFQSLPDPDLFYRQFPETRGKPLVLFLSRIDPVKNIELLLAAFVQVNKAAHLVIAGTGATDYVASLQTLAKSAGIDACVTWAGHLAGDLKLAALAAATIFVLPSKSENFGIALLEAMAAGLPCIASNHVALAVDVAGRDVVQVVPSDSAVLARAIGKQLDDPSGSLAMGHRAAALAREAYSLQAMATALDTIYCGSIRGIRQS